MKGYQTACGRVGIVALVGLLLAGCSESDRPLESPVRFEGGIFGTYYQVTLVDPLTQGDAKALEEGILAEMEDVDQAMSTYRDDSELVAFNGAPIGEWQPLSNELIEVMAISRSVAEASGGAFDITIGDVVNLWSFGPEARPEEVPSDAELSERLATVGFDAVEVDTQRMQARRLRDVFADLSGVAKGHATDRVAAYLDQQGIDNYLVNIGGGLIARGYRDIDAQTPWRIGIEVPQSGVPEAQHVIALEGMSVATSGDYRNYFDVGALLPSSGPANRAAHQASIGVGIGVSPLERLGRCLGHGTHRRRERTGDAAGRRKQSQYFDASTRRGSLAQPGESGLRQLFR